MKYSALLQDAIYKCNHFELFEQGEFVLINFEGVQERMNFESSATSRKLNEYLV